MINSKNNYKSFTLLESIVALIILSVAILSISKLLNDTDTIQTYYKLQEIENRFIKSKDILESDTIKLNHI